MPELPPPLRWIDSFITSIGEAIGSGIAIELEKTVNPLVYDFTLHFEELIAGPRMLQIWNMLQQYAAKNETIPQGKVAIGPFSMRVKLVVKRRLGPPRDEKP